MRHKTAILAAMLVSFTAINVTADEAMDEEPTLRLRLSEASLSHVSPKPLRQRFDARVIAPGFALPQPKVTVQQADRTGRFAFVSTPHPNLVLAVGATDDASEIGRQIDRSITEMTRSEKLFNRQYDSAPFIGLGVRSGSTAAGWSADAAIGLGIFNTPDGTRLNQVNSDLAAERYDTDARAHLKLRNRF